MSIDDVIASPSRDGEAAGLFFRGHGFWGQTAKLSNHSHIWSLAVCIFIHRAAGLLNNFYSKFWCLNILFFYQSVGLERHLIAKTKPLVGEERKRRNHTGDI